MAVLLWQHLNFYCKWMQGSSKHTEAIFDGLGWSLQNKTQLKGTPFFKLKWKKVFNYFNCL